VPATKSSLEVHGQPSEIIKETQLEDYRLPKKIIKEFRIKIVEIPRAYTKIFIKRYHMNIVKDFPS